MQPHKILIVEDEAPLAQVIGEFLAASGFEHHWLDNGLAVVPWVREHGSDLVILDLMLPGVDGLEIYRQLRQFSQVPVIMATARVDELDRLKGLSLGADDYLCKPYSLPELVVRIQNILRRCSSSQAAPENPAPSEAKQPLLCFYPAEQRVIAASGELKLTAVEFRLLHWLWRHPGQIFTREQLMDRAYDDYRVISERTMDSHIRNLRKKLQAALPGHELIKSVYGMGYRLEA